MKKVVLKVALLSVLSAGIFSCASDKEKNLESKVAELESKLARMENSSPAKPANVQAEPTGPAAAFEFDQMEHDFGTIKEGDVVTHVFKFKNTGEAPLIIQKAQGSCGCTVPEYSKEPIAVGEEGTIKVQFNSKGKPGTQNKTVTITANTKPATTRLKIKSVVEKKAGEITAAGPVQN